MAAPKTLIHDRRQFAQLKAEEFSRFLERLEEDSRDAALMRYVYVLFLKIYELELDGRHLTKSQACRFIPLKHAVSCAKYLDEAQKAGYIRFKRDEIDRRKILVKPSQALLDFVEEEIDRSIAATVRTVRSLQASHSGNVRK